jgi:hypothetical protein
LLQTCCRCCSEEILYAIYGGSERQPAAPRHAAVRRWSREPPVAGALSRRDDSAAGGIAPYRADLQLRAVLLELEQQEH